MKDERRQIKATDNSGTCDQNSLVPCDQIATDRSLSNEGLVRRVSIAGRDAKHGTLTWTFFDVICRHHRRNIPPTNILQRQNPGHSCRQTCASLREGFLGHTPLVSRGTLPPARLGLGGPLK